MLKARSGYLFYVSTSNISNFVQKYIQVTVVNQMQLRPHFLAREVEPHWVP